MTATMNDNEISNEAILVRNALIEHGLETPWHDNGLSSAEKKEIIQEHMSSIMQTLGLDYKNFPKVSVFENKMHFDEMVKVCNITITSTCEHHFVVMDGIAKVAYMPSDKIIGLSKVNRIVQFFGHRPQVQERLTQQIKVALQTLLNTKNVAVSITATHYCVKSRGVKDQTSVTTTTALGGLFKNNPSSRHEFLTD